MEANTHIDRVTGHTVLQLTLVAVAFLQSVARLALLALGNGILCDVEDDTETALGGAWAAAVGTSPRK